MSDGSSQDMEPAGGRYDWDRLNKLQTGRFGEYFAKMEFALYGFDIYGSEVDDKGIDFVIRHHVDRFYDVQVKTARLPAGNYVYMRKAKFELRETLLLALILLRQGEPPRPYLIPSLDWERPTSLLCDRDYEGRKSEPEFGIQLSGKNLPLLTQYEFAQQVAELA